MLMLMLVGRREHIVVQFCLVLQKLESSVLVQNLVAHLVQGSSSENFTEQPKHIWLNEKKRSKVPEW